MGALQESSKYIWLTSLLAQKQARIAGLIGRLTALGSLMSVKPAITEKFARLMRQIEAERDKEFEVICEIQDIEDKHRERRLRGDLERADAAYAPGEGEASCEGGNRRNRLWNLLFCWLPKSG